MILWSHFPENYGFAIQNDIQVSIFVYIFIRRETFYSADENIEGYCQD